MERPQFLNRPCRQALPAKHRPVCPRHRPLQPRLQLHPLRYPWYPISRRILFLCLCSPLPKWPRAKDRLRAQLRARRPWRPLPLQSHLPSLRPWRLLPSLLIPSLSPLPCSLSRSPWEPHQHHPPPYRPCLRLPRGSDAGRFLCSPPSCLPTPLSPTCLSPWTRSWKCFPWKCTMRPASNTAEGDPCQGELVAPMTSLRPDPGGSVGGRAPTAESKCVAGPSIPPAGITANTSAPGARRPARMQETGPPTTGTRDRGASRTVCAQPRRLEEPRLREVQKKTACLGRVLVSHVCQLLTFVFSAS